MEFYTKSHWISMFTPHPPPQTNWLVMNTTIQIKPFISCAVNGGHLYPTSCSWCSDLSHQNRPLNDQLSPQSTSRTCNNTKPIQPFGKYHQVCSNNVKCSYLLIMSSPGSTPVTCISLNSTLILQRRKRLHCLPVVQCLCCDEGQDMRSHRGFCQSLICVWGLIVTGLYT